MARFTSWILFLPFLTNTDSQIIDRSSIKLKFPSLKNEIKLHCKNPKNNLNKFIGKLRTSCINQTSKSIEKQLADKCVSPQAHSSLKNERDALLRESGLKQSRSFAHTENKDMLTKNQLNLLSFWLKEKNMGNSEDCLKLYENNRESDDLRKKCWDRKLVYKLNFEGLKLTNKMNSRGEPEFEQLIKTDAKKWMLRITKFYKALTDVDFGTFDSIESTQNIPDFEINFIDFQSAEFNRTYPKKSRDNIPYKSEA